MRRWSDIRPAYIKINGGSRLRYSLLHQAAAALLAVSSSDSKLVGEFASSWSFFYFVELEKRVARAAAGVDTEAAGR